MFPPGTNVRGYVVVRAVDAAAGWHEFVAKDVAGKEVLLRVPPDIDGAERIRGEVALAKAHKHEALLEALDVIEHNGWPVQVLRYVDGITLEALMAAAGKLPPVAVCRIGRHIGAALVALHERGGLAHGALAADRILIDVTGIPRLVDLGCARPVGPKRLRSPERRKAKASASALDDLWALGILLCDAATGTAVQPDRAASSSTDSGVLALPDLSDLPERLQDALRVLIAPVGSRLTNASAAVRVFSDIESRLGDGQQALRTAVMEARSPRSAHATADTSQGPITVLDATNRPFLSFMAEGLDGGLPAGEPDTTDRQQAVDATDSDLAGLGGGLDTQPSQPMTQELHSDAVLSLKQMEQLSALAEEAARRRTGPVRADPALIASAAAAAPAAPAEPNPRITADIHEEPTASDPNRGDIKSFSLNEPRAPSARQAGGADAPWQTFAGQVPRVRTIPADPIPRPRARKNPVLLGAVVGVVIVLLLVVIVVARS